MWVDRAVRLLAPSSSFRTHGRHSSSKAALPEVISAYSCQHVMSRVLLNAGARHNPPFSHVVKEMLQAFTVTALPSGTTFKRAFCLRQVAMLCFTMGGQYQRGQSCQPLHNSSGLIAQDVVPTHSQVQSACLLYPFQCP